MLFIEYAGGLGNQMFQYALFKNLKQKGRNVKCVITHCKDKFPMFNLDIFPNVNYELIEDNDAYFKIKEKHLKRNFFCKVINKVFPVTNNVYYENEDVPFDFNVFRIDNKIIIGYFQGIDYIEPVKDVLKEDFIFPFGEKKLQDFVLKLPTDVASIHIRRGDYLELESIYGGICTIKYYEKAIKYMYAKGITNFVVFSNDIEWVKNNFLLDKAIFVEDSMFDNYQDWYDMYIMSRCSHNILANSTFSWWGAWLNSNENKIVISPPYFENKHKNKKLVDKTWVVIEG